MAIVKKHWAQNKWITYVSEGLNKAAESVVQAGIRMYEFKTISKCCKGGSEFGRIVEEKFGMSTSMSSRWATIGENSAKLLVATKNLPNSMEAIYLVSTLTEEQIKQGINDGVISHESTQRDIKQLKQQESVPQNHSGPNGNEDKEWEALLEEFDQNEVLCTAIWDQVIDKTEAKKIQQGKVNAKRTAKKLYGNVDYPNMLPSQVASILSISQDEADSYIGIKVKVPKKQNRKVFFEVTEDVIGLVKELENPQDIEAMRTEKARELYNHFVNIVELWSEILEKDGEN